MAYNINDIDDLIAKVLVREASAEEEKRLEDWAKISDENRRYVDQISAVFEKVTTPSNVNFDADAAWNKVKSRLNQVPENESTRIPFPVWRIAAGIVMLGVAYALYQWSIPKTETFAAATQGSTLQDTLPDGSMAFLNKKSSISYEYSPGRKTRKVRLKGEGFFEIKHVEEKPFVIEADEILIRDIGTSFNVKAYPESDTIMVTVKEGEVQFYSLENKGINLRMNETGIYDKKLRAFTKLEKADTNVLAYKTGILSFDNTYLKSVIEKINDIYDVRIRLDNPDLGSCRLTVNFRGDSLETILEVIAETLNLSVTREKKEIILSGQGCQ